MVNQAAIQVHIDKGYSIAASKLGTYFALYRPLSNGPVISNINMLTPIYFGFDISFKFPHTAPTKYEQPVHYGLVDMTLLEIGDYLTNGPFTFFVANLEPLKPSMVVRCNHNVSVYRPDPGTPGANYYGGNVGGFGDAEITAWPASILIGPKGERNESGLPADPRSPWHVLLLPAFPTVTIKTGDIVVDDLNRRYTASACELTEHGWHITMAYSGT